MTANKKKLNDTDLFIPQDDDQNKETIPRVFDTELQNAENGLQEGCLPGLFGNDIHDPVNGRGNCSKGAAILPPTAPK